MTRAGLRQPVRISYKTKVLCQAKLRTAHHDDEEDDAARPHKNKKDKWKDIVGTLNALVATPELAASELRQIFLDKWKKSYLCSIKKHGRYYTLEISGFHLEDGSARISEDLYLARLSSICKQIREWGMVEFVCEEIRSLEQEPTHWAGLVDMPCVVPLRFLSWGGGIRETEFLL